MACPAGKFAVAVPNSDAARGRSQRAVLVSDDEFETPIVFNLGSIPSCFDSRIQTFIF